MGLTAVKFVEHYTPYVKGEIAGFPKEQADKLVEEGVAIVYKAGKKAEEEGENTTKTKGGKK